jgi:hypothetical protein
LAIDFDSVSTLGDGRVALYVWAVRLGASAFFEGELIPPNPSNLARRRYSEPLDATFRGPIIENNFGGECHRESNQRGTSTIWMLHVCERLKQPRWEGKL